MRRRCSLTQPETTVRASRSAGGAHSLSTPLGIIVLLTPSLFLGSSFLVLMVVVHQATPPDRRAWIQAALAFATIYTALISINYYVQLTWVGPRLARGELAGMEPFVFTPFDSFLYAVDILGYSFMSLATLFAAPAIANCSARFWLIANGALIPSISSQAEASAAALAGLKDRIEEAGADVIFTEVGTPSDIAEAIADETGATVVELPSHTMPQDGSYFTFVRTIAADVAGALAP